MKIAIITNYWKGSLGGGVKTFLINLVDELKKRDNITVSVIFREGEDSDNYKVRYHRLFFPIKAFLYLRKLRPQVVHSQGTWYCLLPGFIYKKIYGATLVHTFHTKPDRKSSFMVRMFFQSLLSGCDRTTFVSRELEKEIIEHYRYKLKRTAITYGGVQPKSVSKKDAAEFISKFGLTNRTPVLLAQGLTVLKHKADGAKLLIKSIGKLKDEYPNIVLILTRKGPYCDELKRIGEGENIQDKMVFTGELDNPHIPLFICDVFTHTPLYESGLGLALLEAMSMGKAIVATSVGGIPEAIDNMENGILVKPDEDEIAEAINRLLTDKHLASKLGENAKVTADQKFTWERAAYKFQKIYEEHQ